MLDRPRAPPGAGREPTTRTRPSNPPEGAFPFAQTQKDEDAMERSIVLLMGMCAFVGRKEPASSSLASETSGSAEKEKLPFWLNLSKR